MRGCSCRGTAGFVHVSCLAEQAKILLAEAEENNLDWKVKQARWERWRTCSLCEQDYHGVVRCALGWGCWKTYVGRPETDPPRRKAMNVLGSGLFIAGHREDALSVHEAELATMRRFGASERNILAVQGSLAITYGSLGRKEEALQMRRNVYSERLKLDGEENRDTLTEANNYGVSLLDLGRYEEAKPLFRKAIPIALRVLGEGDELGLGMRLNYGQVLCHDGATLDDLREAVTTLEETERTARRVFGGAHPLTTGIEGDLRNSRAVLRAREAGHRVLFTHASTASRGRVALLATFPRRAQSPLRSDARHQTRAARSVPSPRASSRLRGDRRHLANRVASLALWKVFLAVYRLAAVFS